jgi:DNA modification methylase
MLLNGDCLQLMNEIEDNSIDMVFCDLPYGTTSCAWDSIIPLDKLWEQYSRVTKQNAAIVLTSAQPFTTILASSNLKDFKYSMVYQKTYATQWFSAKRRPMPDHEDVLVFYREQPTYNPQMVWNGTKTAHHVGGSELYAGGGIDEGNRGGAEDRYPRTTLGPYTHAKYDMPKELGIKCHPTQKQQELIQWFIKTFTNEGETVLDNTMGSGSTGIACLRTNREFVGIEMDPDIFGNAKQWIDHEVELIKNPPMTLEEFF